MVIGETTPSSGAPPDTPRVLYVIAALDTAIGVMMREDACGSDAITGPYVRRTGWMRFVARDDYFYVWAPKFEQLGGDPLQRNEQDPENTIEVWLMPYSQLSDHEGYTGDNV